MLQKVNTVFVGKNVNTTGATLVKGDIVLVNASTGAPMAIADLAPVAGEAGVPAIQLGYVKSTGSTDADANIVKTQTISRGKVVNVKNTDYVAKTEAVATLDWTAVTFVEGYRYVIRIIYKDLYEHPGQFTHTYELIYNGTDTVDQFGAKFKAIINKHAGRRVNAEYTEGTDILTLTAKVIDGPEAGIATKEAITPYSQVAMTVVAYYTNPSTLLGNSYEAINGLVIVNTPSKPGKGNPFIVRDREQAALGYKGITYRTTWPVIKPELNVDLTKTYDELVVEFDKEYQSPDNQYVKNTGIAAEVYVEHNNDLDTLSDAISLWASLVGPQGEAGV